MKLIELTSYNQQKVAIPIHKIIGITQMLDLAGQRTYIDVGADTNESEQGYCVMETYDEVCDLLRSEELVATESITMPCEVPAMPALMQDDITELVDDEPSPIICDKCAVANPYTALSCTKCQSTLNTEAFDDDIPF